MVAIARSFAGLTVLCSILLLGSPGPAQARYIPAGPPCGECCPPCGCCGGNQMPKTPGGSPVTLNQTQGSACTAMPIPISGDVLNLSVNYSSANADGGHAQIDIGLGYGWTHSYSQFLFTQRGSMFLLDGGGQVTRFRRTGYATYAASEGHCQDLTRNADGSFALTDQNENRYRFKSVPGDTVRIGGPVLRLIRIDRRNGQQIALDYDALGRLATVRDLSFASGVRFEYSSAAVRIVDTRTARVTRLDYDGTGRKLVKITEPPAAAGQTPQTTAYAYNLNYQITQVTDRNGERFTIGYRGGHPVSVRDGSGTILIDNTNPLNWAMDEEVLDRRWITIRKVGDTADTCDPAGHVNAPDWCEYSKHDAADNIVARIDANGNRTDAAYVANDWLASETQDPGGLNLITAYTYDSAGKELTVTNPRGNLVTTTYDERDRRVRVDDLLGRVATYAYDGI